MGESLDLASRMGFNRLRFNPSLFGFVADHRRSSISLGLLSGNGDGRKSSFMPDTVWFLGDRVCHGEWACLGVRFESTVRDQGCSAMALVDGAA